MVEAIGSVTIAEWKLVIPHIGRDFSDDDWKSLEPKYVEIWKEAQTFYDGICLVHDDSKIKLWMDLNPIISKFEDIVSRMERLFYGKDQTAFEDYNSDEIYVNIKSEVIEQNARSHHWMTSSVIRFMIYEIFLSMNLCVPGSCNLYNSYLIKDPPEVGYRGRDTRHEIDLRGRSFEASLFEAEKYPWLKRLPFNYTQVQQWVATASPRFSMVPSNPVSRSILALMHLSKTEEGPMSIIWIFYALESLFQCRTGENFNILSNRISLLLSLEESEEKTMRKLLRKLYDVRSSIVHGGAEIVHPLMSDELDKKSGDASWKYVEATDFGSAIIIRSLQEMINRNLTELYFRESIIAS